MAAGKSEGVYDEVVDLLVQALTRGASGAGFSFDGQDMPGFYKKLAERKKMLDSLKKKMGKGKIKASEWCPVMAKADHLSRIQRDIEMRYRSRIGSFRRRMLAGGNGISALLAMRSTLEEIQKA